MAVSAAVTRSCNISQSQSQCGSLTMSLGSTQMALGHLAVALASEAEVEGAVTQLFERILGLSEVRLWIEIEFQPEIFAKVLRGISQRS